MPKTRLEAFSDAVIAIIITIMVLELKVPDEMSASALGHVVPTMLAYVLSFVFIGGYWVNHHHLLLVAERVNSRVLWANLHLLFWISLIPASTHWIGEHPWESLPTAVYGAVLLMCSVAGAGLTHELVRLHGHRSALKYASTAPRWKIIVSAALGLSSMPLAFVHPLVADVCFAALALLWTLPSRATEALLMQVAANAAPEVPPT